MEKEQSSGLKRKRTSDSLEINQIRESDEDVAKEELKGSEEGKQQKGKCSTAIRNRNERLRRKKLGEIMKALQELLPNCKKRDKASILDDAIKYIKSLQYQVQEHQMMSMGAAFSMVHSPTMMIPPQPGQPGMELPNLTPFPIPPKAGTGTGTGMSSSFTCPMNQMGLSIPCLIGSVSSGLDGPGGQNPGNFLERLDWAPCYATSFTSSGSQCMTQGQNSPCAPTNKGKEFSNRIRTLCVDW